MKNRMNKIFQTLKKVVRKIINFLLSPFWLIHNFPGVLLETKTKIDKKPIIFCDQYGFNFWLYPEDEIYFNWKRKAVLDSTNVVNFILKFVQPGNICFDIGSANAGISVPMWSKVGKSGKVISVEADPIKIEKVKKNLTLNNYPDNYVANVAISNNKEIRKFRCFPDSPGWNTFGDPPFAKGYKSFTIDVQCIDFETLLNNYDISYVDLVKIDTEGAELLILKGMQKKLQNQQIGCVIFEVNPLMLPGMDTTVDELLSFWINLSYDLYKLAPDGTIEPLLDSWSDNEVGDCVAILKQ
jgi:FkbM family methyltransferase